MLGGAPTVTALRFTQARMKSRFLSAMGCLSALASATGGAVVHVDARNPAEALRLRFEDGSGVTELGLRPDDTWAHPDLQVTGGEKSRGVFRSDSDADGAVAHAHLHCTFDCLVDFALISRAGSILLALNGTLPGRQGTLPSPDAHPIRHGRRAQLQLPAPPYVRLSNCDWAGVKMLTLGLAIDKGFVAAVGGTDAAMTEAASAVSRANFVYEGQLGVRLLVTHVVINSDDAPVGQAPDVPGSRDTCEAYFPRVIEGHGLTVQADDIEAALDLFSWWVGCGGGGCDGIAGAPVEPAEGPALWHLLTDCFPPTGVVGIAGLRAVCNAPRRIEFGDSGIPARRPGQPDDACDVVVQSTGNCALKFATESCDSEDKICTANTAVSSWSRRGSFWHTFAHEIGHNLGGEHTFEYDSNGNLLYDYGGSAPTRTPLAPTLLSTAQGCLAIASRVAPYDL